MGLVETASRGLKSGILAAAVSLGATSCVREYVLIQTGVAFPEPMLFEDAMSWTREAADAVQTLHDFETARDVAFGNMGTMEGLHKLVPENEDGLFLLTRSWAGISYAFMDDEREAALDVKDEALAAYHEARARAGFQRARFYGEELVGIRAEGFKEAQRNADSLKAWLREHYTNASHADELLWLGFSIVGRVAFDLDNPKVVSELWIGVEILEHVVALDETIEYGSAHTMLGAYYARSPQSELADAKQHFDRALQINGGKVLTAQVTLASRYYCNKRDKANYFKTLNAVLEAKDPMPQQRLSNTIAKRRAFRYLNNKYWQEECAFEG
jgi:hypothetical protein